MEVCCSLQVDVRGVAVTQGSMVVRGRYAVHERKAALEAWRGDIAAEASRQMGRAGLWTGPVLATVTFALPRPKSAPRRVVYPAKRPDIDKLARAVLDALSGVVFEDDAQVVDLFIRKRYVDGSDHPYPGVQVYLHEVKE